MQVTLPDGNSLDLPDGATGADAAAAIGPGLAKAALAIRVNGDLRDLARPLEDGAPIQILTGRDEAAALERFVREGQDYKVELIEDLVRDEGVETVSLYTNGPFTDLCRGPHSPSTGRVGAFKLQSVAGAYWRGNADNPMLTRIYGTAFPT